MQHTAPSVLPICICFLLWIVASHLYQGHTASVPGPRIEIDRQMPRYRNTYSTVPAIGRVDNRSITTVTSTTIMMRSALFSSVQ